MFSEYFVLNQNSSDFLLRSASDSTILVVGAIAEKNGKTSDEQTSFWTETGKETASKCNLFLFCWFWLEL